jgi:hypothetical protein
MTEDEIVESDRQKLLNELGRIIGEVFCEGLNEASDPVKRSVLHGLSSNRVRITVLITMPPLKVSVGIVGVDGTNPIMLFEIEDPKRQQFRVAPQSSGSDAIQ